MSVDAKHPTELAALNFIDYLTYKLDNSIVSINIYIDLLKAFDTLTHSMLLDKLSYYGVNSVAKNLLQSYLSHRHQVVDFNGSTSDTLEIRTGVPKGSVLWPVLFAVYINDLPSCTDMFNMMMYAGDTTLFCTDEHVLNTELYKITDWLSTYKLSLNVNKTKCMVVFHSDKKNNCIQSYSLMLSKSNVLITLIFWGLQLNHTLKWNKKLSCVSLKI